LGEKRRKLCESFQGACAPNSVQDFADFVLDIFDNMRTAFPRASATAATTNREKLAKKMEQRKQIQIGRGQLQNV